MNLLGEERGCVYCVVYVEGTVCGEEEMLSVVCLEHDVNNRPGKREVGKAEEIGGSTVRPPCP